MNKLIQNRHITNFQTETKKNLSIILCLVVVDDDNSLRSQTHMHITRHRLCLFEYGISLRHTTQHNTAYQNSCQCDSGVDGTRKRQVPNETLIYFDWNKPLF